MSSSALRSDRSRFHMFGIPRGSVTGAGAHGARRARQLFDLARPGGIHLDAAVEAGALGDVDRRRLDVAAHVRLLAHGDRRLGLQVALDLSLDDDHVGGHRRLDHGFRTDGHPRGRANASLDLAVDHEVLVGGQLALEAERGAQNRGAVVGGVIRIGHAGSPDSLVRSVLCLSAGSPARIHRSPGARRYPSLRTYCTTPVTEAYGLQTGGETWRGCDEAFSTRGITR